MEIDERLQTTCEEYGVEFLSAPVDESQNDRDKRRKKIRRLISAAKNDKKLDARMTDSGKKAEETSQSTSGEEITLTLI